jgi:hypothetical protein
VVCSVPDEKAAEPGACMSASIAGIAIGLVT